MSRAFKYGDNIDTDCILPGQYLSATDAAALAPHCMEGIDPDFARTVQPGDVVVAGKNFGCGSSREHAPMALKGAKVRVIIAASFARIFFRNAINIGLPVLECKQAADAIEDGDDVDLDLAKGMVTNESRGLTFTVTPLPPFIQEIIASGGLIEHIRKQATTRY